VVAECEKAGFNPVQALIEVAKAEGEKFAGIDWGMRVRAMTVLCEKSSQTFKSVEHKTDESQHSAMLDAVNAVMSPLLDEHKRDY
jgi:hypothetical protein